MRLKKRVEQHDVLVVGVGVFGAWTALSWPPWASVLLVDAYGPGNSRASSGGESRISDSALIVYTRWRPVTGAVERTFSRNDGIAGVIS